MKYDATFTLFVRHEDGTTIPEEQIEKAISEAKKQQH